LSRIASARALRREIQAAVQAGRSVDEIDAEIISPCALDPDARSALWLFAWGCIERAADDPSWGHAIDRSG
jgi:hypothetical protein